MHKIGKIVVVHGKGKINGNLYFHKKATILDCDSYYKDYYVLFCDGTKDWISHDCIYPTTNKKKYKKKRRRKKHEN